jgi:hypothetical protein
MKTSTKAPVTRRAKPADTCRLTVHIRGVAYAVRPLANPDGRAYRLRNTTSGKVYDVAEGAHGPTCDCEDAVYRHDDGES